MISKTEKVVVRSLLADARQRLTKVGIPEAALEARLLLAHAMGIEPTQLLLEPDLIVSVSQSAAFEAFMMRRLTREPVAYIIGEREFYGLSFQVDKRVLIPRPETELLVETALTVASERAADGEALLIADVGTGSGCIVVSLAVHLQKARFFGLDLSQEAVTLAQSNAQRHGVSGRIVFLDGNLLEPLPEPVDVIVANPPYVPTPNVETIQPEIRLHEPRMAVEGGNQGLEVTRRLLMEAEKHLLPRGAFLMETGHGQASDVVAAAKVAFPTATRIDMIPDLAGIPRMLRVQLP